MKRTTLRYFTLHSLLLYTWTPFPLVTEYFYIIIIIIAAFTEVKESEYFFHHRAGLELLQDVHQRLHLC